MPESASQPYLYDREHVDKSLELLDELATLGRLRGMFSVNLALRPRRGFRGAPLDHPPPHAHTKRVMEMILKDMSAAPDLGAGIPRYFKPYRL